MPELTQKSIELFFQEYGVTDPDVKARLLPMVTDIIYDYNMHIIELEKETDEYKKKQIVTGTEELTEKIKEIFETELNA